MKGIFVQKYLKYIILIAAAGFIAAGIFRDELALIFKKAAAICLECCGIG